MTDGWSGTDSIGPIASSYEQLQSLPALHAIIDDAQYLVRGGRWQAVRAMYQCAEIVIITLEALGKHLMDRIAAGDTIGVRRSITWQTAFARAWVALACKAKDFAGEAEEGSSPGVGILDATVSPNWSLLQHTERDLALDILASMKTPQSIFVDDEEVRLGLLNYSMLQRIGSEYFQTEAAPAYYDEFVRPSELRNVVYERLLSESTVFMQFRSAHQIPEIIAVALNDHVESAIEAVRAAKIPEALRFLRRAERLADALAESASILSENLTTGEYHAIRENLGLTSGSHSVALHYHLMRDLYPRLESDVRTVERRGSAALTDLLTTQARSIGLHIDRWRLQHLKLPRNNLGGAGTGTRSLTGSKDAVTVVGRMRDRSLGALGGTEQVRRATDWKGSDLALAEVESRLLELVSEGTKERFVDVQERTGYFSSNVGFDPPEVRVPGKRRE